MTQLLASRAALVLALFHGTLGLPYAPGMLSDKILGAVLILLLIALMPLGWLLATRMARLRLAQGIAAGGVAALSLLGLAGHATVFASAEPLAALVLILYVVPAQIIGSAAMFAALAWANRRTG
jgi:hypothetical protein